MFGSCNSSDDNNNIGQGNEIILPTNVVEVVSVSVSGDENNYNYSVGIASPDTGCEQYANWWEIISEDGATLIYRRILGHSHVTEQPFIRSGGIVQTLKDETVIIRAHMNNSGYGVRAFKGSVALGFSEFTLSEDFAAGIENLEPLPTSCAF